jgi:cardiolipin synthase
MKVDRLLTVPNLITTVRLACIPLFVWILFGAESRAWAGWLLGSLAATDWIDGYVARRFHQTSNFGTMYDPTVDRMMLVVGIISILVDGSAPWWFCVIVLVREVAVSAWVVAITSLGAKRMDVTWWGKVGAFANMAAFPAFLLASDESLASAIRTGWRVFAWAALVPGVVFSVLSAFQYIGRGRQALAEGRHADDDVV